MARFLVHLQKGGRSTFKAFIEKTVVSLRGDITMIASVPKTGYEDDLIITDSPHIARQFLDCTTYPETVVLIYIDSREQSAAIRCARGFETRCQITQLMSLGTCLVTTANRPAPKFVSKR